jgi:hypothetical protein
MTYFSRIIIYLFAALSLLSCGEESSAPPDEPVTQDPSGSSTEALLTRAERQLSAYYQALEREQIEVDQYFAPQVDQFFDARNLTRDQVGSSLRNGFAQVDNRQLRIDPSSLELSEIANGYEVTFRGVATTNGTQSEFRNQVTFNRDWLITSYTPVSSSTNSRGLAAREANGSLIDAAVRTLGAFRQGDLSSISDLIHPTLGYYFLYSPGAMSVPKHYQALSAMSSDAPWMAEANQAIDPRPTQAALPTFSCDDDFSKSGCFLQTLAQPYRAISQLQSTLVEVDLMSPDEIDGPAVNALEAQVSAQMIDTDAFLGFYFGNIDGQWYLLIIDSATYDCSA